MFHSYFLGSSEGLLFDVPVDDYDTAFWAPLGGLPAPARRRGPDAGERAGARPDRRAGRGGDRPRAAERGHRRPGHRPPHHPPAGRTARTGSTTPAGASGSPRPRTRPGTPSGACGSTAGWTRAAPRSSAPAATARWTTSPCSSASRRAPGAGPTRTTRRWSRCTRTRSRPRRRRRDAQADAPRRARPGLPRDGRRAGRGGGVAGRGRLPAGRHQPVAAPPRGAHARRPARARRRRDPLRLPRGADGAGGHHRLPGRQPAAGGLGPRRARPVDGAHQHPPAGARPGPRRCSAAEHAASRARAPGRLRPAGDRGCGRR